MQVQRRSRGRALLFNLGARSVWPTPSLERFITGRESLPILQDAEWASGHLRASLTSDRLRTLIRPARSQSLCPLRYPCLPHGSVHKHVSVYLPDHSICSFVRRTMQIIARGYSETSCQVQSTSEYTAYKLQDLQPHKSAWSPPLTKNDSDKIKYVAVTMWDMINMFIYTKMLKEWHRVEYLEVDGRVILKWIL
jgi:hypothetical protein